MSYIPKSAQRKIDKYNSKTRVIQLSPEAEAKLVKAFEDRKPAEPPKRLRSGQPGAGLWDVYFNGVKQHLCAVADVEQGFVIRYLHGKGNTPTTSQTEQVRGYVEIVRKGTQPSLYVNKDVANLIVSPATAADMQEAGISMAGVEVVESVNVET